MPISYAPTSWNPTVGCTPVSEGCKNCWAMKLHNQRHTANVKAAKTHPLKPTTQYARLIGHALPCPPQYDVPFGDIQLLPARLEEPLHWRKPRTVAVCFMGDLFHGQVPGDFILEVLKVIGRAEQHRFLVLTKRPGDMRLAMDLLYESRESWNRAGERHGMRKATIPLPNLWLGVTAENQRMADERIPLLLDTPGKHWVSLEPLLGPVDLGRARALPIYREADEVTEFTSAKADYRPIRRPGRGWRRHDGNMQDWLDWCVVGGESGPGHRRMDLQWAADVYAQCRAANVPAYFKQIAASRPGQPSGVAALDDAKALPWHGEHAEPPQEEG